MLNYPNNYFVCCGYIIWFDNIIMLINVIIDSIIAQILVHSLT